MTAIKFCTCVSKEQDKRYGDNMRVWNKTRKHPTSSGGWRCTVCKKEQS